jgi:A/G-specific adenine glycosylase
MEVNAVRNQWKDVAAALKRWGSRNQRRMPWRNESDVYHLAVAEILLQKTKASDVLPVWTAVLKAFPTPGSLANSDSRRLLMLVKHLGLGNQRVGRLKAMANSLAGTASTRISGLGPYGRGILVLATGGELKTAPVDGNISRFVCRLNGLTFSRGEPRKKPEVKKTVEQLLLVQNSAKQKLHLIYAIVDLGASVCKVGTPVCGDCPVSKWCDFSESIGRSK